MFIELHSYVDGLRVLININQITAVDDDDEYRIVHTTGTCTHTVKETYEEIYDKIRMAERI